MDGLGELVNGVLAQEEKSQTEGERKEERDLTGADCAEERPHYLGGGVADHGRLTLDLNFEERKCGKEGEVFFCFFLIVAYTRNQNANQRITSLLPFRELANGTAWVTSDNLGFLFFFFFFFPSIQVTSSLFPQHQNISHAPLLPAPPTTHTLQFII